MSCSAPNCTNRDRGGFKLYRFPADEARRAVWVQNSRRANWQPNHASRLCEVHFELSQFECHRQDGKIKLKSTAVPTIFNFPNFPNLINSERKSQCKEHSTSSALTNKNDYNDKTNENVSTDQWTDKDVKIQNLEKEIKMLRNELQKKNQLLAKFFNADQLNAMEKNNN